MAKRKTTDGNAPICFETALAELEAIARDLDGGTLGLDESLARFEQGVKLLRQCYRTLDDAEQKIALLTGFDAAGNPVTTPFDATATAEQGVAGRRKQPQADAADDADSAGKGLF